MPELRQSSAGNDNCRIDSQERRVKFQGPAQRAQSLSAVAPRQAGHQLDTDLETGIPAALHCSAALRGRMATSGPLENRVGETLATDFNGLHTLVAQTRKARFIEGIGPG